MRTSKVSSVLGLLCLSLLGAACVGEGSRGPNDDTSSSSTSDALPIETSVVHRDARTGLPRFAWLGLADARSTELRGKPAREAAWTTLRGIARSYGLRREVIESAELESIHDAGTGPIVARFRQRVDDIEVFRSHMSLAFTRNMDPVAASGSLARVPRASDRLPFTLDARAAVAIAARAAGTKISEGDVGESGELGGGYSRFTLATGALGHRHEVAPTRAKKVWFDGAKGLEPAYYIELHLGSDATDDTALRSFVVSADEGTVLFAKNMTESEAYTYRVYADPSSGPHPFHPYVGPQGHGGLPHPTGRPNGFQAPFVSSNLVTLESAPFSKNDPWLPPGSTSLTGNNVDAFANLVAPDGFQNGDLRPQRTAPNTFDFTYDHTKTPGATDANIHAATTQLFYTVNYMHDWFYDAGWDEAAHNPQQDNYGRGGVGGDPITAQAQDIGGRNNANASTPADGASPRIRMYIFDGNSTKKLLTPTGEMTVNTVAFGPKVFMTTGAVVRANPAEACTAPLTNAGDLAGKIALVDRGTCSAILKVKNAQDAGALGVVIANNQPGAPPGFTAASDVDASTITIPTLTVSQEDGTKLEAALDAGPLEITLRRDEAIDRDGSLDASVVAHEWGHILSNRLVGNGNGLTGQQARGMGEGWSDFVALLMTTLPEDATAQSNPDWSGSYAVGTYDESGGENEGYYFGIRRYPYSVDFHKNPLTFKHIQDGTPLPTTAPISFGQNGASNSEVHNTGEVWATMLWECYVSLLRDPRYTFEQANAKMRKYLVASLSLTPIGPTIAEARDAVLAAAYATDKQDFQHFALAFARRGAGVTSVGPASESTNNVGVTESFVTGADVEIVSAKIEGTVSACNAHGILRNGETGKLTVTVRNNGTAPLLATTMTLSSPGGNLGFPNGTVVNVPPLAPFKSATLVVDVSLTGATTEQTIETHIDVIDPDLAVPRTVTLVHKADYDYDVAPASSRTDKFDTPVSVFTVGFDSALDTFSPWHRVPEGTKERWTLLDAPTTSDHWLVTPALVVGDTTLKLTFDHRYQFEASSKKNFDGGVIELNIDGDSTWTDIGALASPGYAGILDFNKSTNPLKSRAAFVGTSPGYPAYLTTTVDLGTAFSGSTIKIRFRAGTDEGTGATGWDITRVSVEGTTNTPFPMRIAVGPCPQPTPTPSN